MMHPAITFHHLCPAIDIGRYFWSKFSQFHPSACIRIQYALHQIVTILSKLVIDLNGMLALNLNSGMSTLRVQA